jgi:hypothetical protein
MIAMNFPRYWARGRAGDYICWRWSDADVEDAQAQATEAARRLAERCNVAGPSAAERYGYSDRPLREPVLREIRGADGSLAAVVTRNSYGCEVLNTAGAMFVDVDIPEAPKKEDAPSLAGLFKSLFGQSAPPVPKTQDLMEREIAKAEAWGRQQPGWNWRIYRTQGGLRLLATHRLFDPADPVCQAAFHATGADPLYRKLCQTQQCFRARLTPKPWRCDLPDPPARWPFDTASAERMFAGWEGRYKTVSAGLATCQLVKVVGGGDVHPEIQPLVELHDQATRATSGMPLA